MLAAKNSRKRSGAAGPLAVMIAGIDGLALSSSVGRKAYAGMISIGFAMSIGRRSG